MAMEGSFFHESSPSSAVTLSSLLLVGMAMGRVGSGFWATRPDPRRNAASLSLSLSSLFAEASNFAEILGFLVFDRKISPFATYKRSGQMKMFSFSRRRMKLGSFNSSFGYLFYVEDYNLVKKVQLSEYGHGTRSPIRPPKGNNNAIVESALPAGSHSDEFDSQVPSTAPEINSSGNSENWMVLSVAGEKPVPRFNHAAAVVGNKMIVVGGESGNGLLDDVQVINWKLYLVYLMLDVSQTVSFVR
ncbi:hypothetical protein F3Y22_tig00112349pilonHSYRG00105 [Hibiscus syriacus]|uniref:Galactose oxidase/kelch repeat superfamily protein n=1 Tax=Hibiscus syriacus TaxID=106335 RepID=A0A6A2YB18_HIBSY|nr:hypothetical protein F3Y22_tig00112349pilonHSYRG00105 [Hibiscus syriacus]